MKYQKASPFRDRGIQAQAVAVAEIGKVLRKAAAELYPDVPYRQWTAPMWDRIWERGEEMWGEREVG